MKLHRLPVIFSAFLIVGAMVFSVGCRRRGTTEGEGQEETVSSASATTASVAVANGRAVSRADFDEMYERMVRPYKRRNQEVPEDVVRRYRTNIVNRLVDKVLLEQEMERQEIRVSDEELEQAFDEYKEMFRTEDNFQRYLEASGTTVEQVRENLRYNAALDTLLDGDDPIAITDEEVEEYYEKQKQHYRERDRVKIEHILVRVSRDADEESKAAARSKAESAHTKATRPGADFEAIKGEYTDVVTSNLTDADGYVVSGRLPADVDAAVAQLQVGEVSSPVKSPLGFHVVRLVERQEGGYMPFADVDDSIRRLMLSRQKQIRQAQILRNLRSQATITINEEFQG